MSGDLDDGAPADAQAPLPAGEPPLPDATWAWPVLDIAPTGDETEIRRAYVRRLKAIDPETDAPAFIELRQARDLTLFLARRAAHEEAAQAAAVAPAESAAPEARPAPAAAAPTAPSAPTQREQPEIDPALFQGIERILFGDDPGGDEALGALAAELFAHPALDRIAIAESVENWAVNVIVNAAPRSDAMIEPAIARFGWDENLTDWRRPPVLDWILERRRDAAFERDLVAEHPDRAEMLRLLRTPGTPPPERPAWKLADNVAAFLAYARLHHQTSIALCQRDAVEAWDAWLKRPPSVFYRTFGGPVRSWRGRSGSDAVFAPRPHQVSGGLLIGLLFLPFIFAWPLMRAGNPMILRLLALGWMSAYIAAFAFAPPDSGLKRSLSPGVEQAASRSSDPAIDLNPILSRITHGQLDLVGLEQSNPRLHAQLLGAWGGQDQDDYGGSLEHRIVMLMEAFYREALRAAPPAIQADYWRLKVEELNWLRPYGGHYCAQVARDMGYANSYRFPQEMRDRSMAIRVAIWRNVREVPPPRGTSTLIPGPIVAAAARRAHLEAHAFDAALRGDGPEENICAAQIGLAETALARPPAESARLVGDMTSLE